MQPEQIVQIVSNVLAFVLALELLPGLRGWWGGDIGKKWKPLIILVLCLLIPLGVMGLECAGYDARQDVVCDSPQSIPMWLTVLSAGLTAFVVSQIGYITLAKPLSDRLDGKEAAPKITVEAPVTIQSDKTVISEGAIVEQVPTKGVAARIEKPQKPVG